MIVWLLLLTLVVVCLTLGYWMLWEEVQTAKAMSLEAVDAKTTYQAHSFLLKQLAEKFPKKIGERKKCPVRKRKKKRSCWACGNHVVGRSDASGRAQCAKDRKYHSKPCKEWLL